MAKNRSVGKLRIKPVTELIDKRKIQLLGHIIRSNRNDPMKQVTFCDGSLTPVTPALRRVGRPRQKWNEYVLMSVTPALMTANIQARKNKRTLSVSTRSGE